MELKRFVTKGEIAQNQFLLLTQYFHKSSAADVSKWKRVNRIKGRVSKS